MSGLKDEPVIEGLSDQQVGDFLAQNPDFLARNPDVLKSMIAPSRWGGDGQGGSGIADMQQFMLQQLRGEIDNLRDCAQDVIETSRTNMSVQMRTHTAVLAMLSATGFDQMLRVIDDDFSLLLDIDVAVIGFEPSFDAANPFAVTVNAPTVRHLAKGDVDAFIGPEQDVVLVRDMSDDGTLFGEAAGLAQSAAIARIRPGRHSPMGLLALGSRGSVFYPGQGTEMIGFLARVLERCIDRWHSTEN
ncbi:MAG TPA: DUF484 family protein [Rhodospirillales bacterium]|nr:DUF484 family protein [Rhodospirillales bacterium]